VPKDCCKIPFGDVFKQDKMKGSIKDCKPTSTLLKWANSYQVNNIQQIDIKNFIDVTNKDTSNLLLELSN